MNRVLVTGSTGFIGSHVAEFLLEQGLEVIQSDIQAPSKKPPKWVHADLRDISQLVTATRGVDGICHLGGIGDVYLAETNPELAMLVNAYGTANLIQAAKRNSVKRFVYASTWEVYGQAQRQPVDESHPCLPTHPYSISKLAGDLATQFVNSPGSPSGVVLRLGTAYGPRMRTTAVIAAYIARASQGEAIPVHGRGDQFRQFTHARDIARAFHLALHAKTPSRVYNVVSPRQVTILHLAQAIASRFDVELEFHNPRPHDPPSISVSSHLIERELGWGAGVSFEEGLEELMKDAGGKPERPP